MVCVILATIIEPLRIDGICHGWRVIWVSGFTGRLRFPAHRLTRRITMDEERGKLIEEIGQLALQYEMNHGG